ncbi:MAG: hypothetical protein SOW92_09390 [Kiritimatiellia bacterium]|nr:hypothetical protein [Kiritimatiellia bacterium]
MQNCGKAKSTKSCTLGIAEPRKIVAKITLMRKPGVFCIAARNSPVTASPAAHITASPTSPPMMDDGR